MATACPIPELAPVTNAFWPARIPREASVTADLLAEVFAEANGGLGPDVRRSRQVIVDSCPGELCLGLSRHEEDDDRGRQQADAEETPLERPARGSAERSEINEKRSARNDPD